MERARKILIIDDEEDILELLDIVFKDSGYEVALSRCSLDTEHVGTLNPDLILLDVRLAGSEKDGAEMCREIKDKKYLQYLPAILISAEHDIKSIARDCKADNYVAKPFEIWELVTKVDGYLHDRVTRSSV
ncbi:response regulator [Parapedobacter koreensis]|uniref:Two-component system, OmpR family, alkaline phosphatase synthesis response regulator PhoP n=1 Tax=Parapedobacter koreensis TaxID=332977 RepID=A0A1H7FNJ8_9SPHI|nr:response regulator [Parapedobacter koreensis]SEK26042.1 two-component system, OmpR family, alkaline phosphatase synthesis response regulator PhoP [Parapedobacter koreensis]